MCLGPGVTAGVCVLIEGGRYLNCNSRESGAGGTGGVYLISIVRKSAKVAGLQSPIGVGPAGFWRPNKKVTNVVIFVL